METLRYLTARYCSRGHLRTDAVEEEVPEDFCSKCGAPTLTQCPNCNAQLHGAKVVSAFDPFGNPEEKTLRGRDRAGQFCRECGKPYPWIAAEMEAALELLTLWEIDEAAQLIDELPDMMTEGPRAAIGEQKWARAMAAAGSSGKFAKGIAERMLARLLTNALVQNILNGS